MGRRCGRWYCASGREKQGCSSKRTPTDQSHRVILADAPTGVPQAGPTLTEDVIVNFSHFGIPVSIAAPQASSVASYEHFEATAQSEGSSQRAARSTHPPADWDRQLSGARPGLLPAFSLRSLRIPAPDSRLTGKSAISTKQPGPAG
jgi:hypothetical protein